MAVDNASGVSAHLVLQPDAGVSSLLSQLSVGQTLRGRITDLLPDGRAVVTFRGVPVTAELKGVSLVRGESISVVVQDLKGQPVLRLEPSSAAAVPAPAPDGGGAAETLLVRLGLPRDSFHGSIVRLLREYGVEVTREAALAVKGLVVNELGGGIPGGAQAIETAVYMHANGLPANREIARAAREFLFGEARLPAVLAQLEAVAAETAAGARPGLPGPVTEALDGVVAASRGIRVDPGRDGMPGQLKAAVEGMGLGHEGRLARAVAAGGMAGLERLRETLKGTLLGLLARIAAGPPPPGGRGTGLESLRGLAEDALRIVEAQQVGSLAQRNSTVVYVQVPVVLGEEVRGGDIQVAWRREKGRPGRDPRKPAHMTLTLETRALGPVTVEMRMLGQGLSLLFNVADGAAREFVNGELPELVRRLAGRRFRMNQCLCEVAAGDEGGVDEAPPTSSLDLKV